jgi:large conductance mechanosensitive channel
MRKFFGEFKKFISRGNVVDLAVGVIIGSAFTAIVNGLSNFVLKPIINWLLALILGKGSLNELYTFLGTPTYLEDGVTIDLANSFYIDWGSLINAIINFLLIAIVLFVIVKVINKMKENNEKMRSELSKLYLDKDERKELKEAGVNIKDKKAVAAYFAEKEAKEKVEAEEKARLEKEANPTELEVLKQIKALLENKQ